MLTSCLPQGVDFIIAGPPCQPYSAAGLKKGVRDPRSLALIATARIIRFLDSTQPRGVGYIIENVPDSARHVAVRNTLGQGTLLDAPPCGSHAKRAAIFWQNMVCPRALRQSFNALPPGPPSTINQLLHRLGFQGWATQHLKLGHNICADDLLNQAGRDQLVLPKFVCFKGSHQFMMRGGRPAPGLMRHEGVLTIPCADIKEACMGFHVGDTRAPDLSEDERSHLLG